MKLRYYLRGLGIGMVVTALILSIASGGKEGLSDEEIKLRAAQLGMMESNSLTLADVNTMNSKEPTTAPSEPIKETPEPAIASPEPITKSPEPATAPPEPTIEPQKQNSDNQHAEGAAEAIKITVESGASSYTVSKMLAESLLWEEGAVKEFDNYLCDNGYSRGIRVGTHKIPVDASWEEIAMIITGKK